MNKPDFYHASDYAGLSFKNGSFYYGYEHTVCLECGKTNNPGHEYCDVCEDADRDWCFVATLDGEEIVIPFSKLGAEDMFDVVDCLMVGVGWILAKYKLVS
jgi:uncharacterized OB-fold protein